jgi:hypothetical protein
MSTVEEIVAAIKDLSPEKRDEVRRRLVSVWLLNARDLAEQRQYSQLPNLPIKRARPRRPPIQIKGRPISETVVEDRR